MTTPDPAIVKLENVRLSYPNLFVPKAIEAGKEPKYSATFLLDKVKHKALIARLEAIAERVALDFFKKKISLKSNGVRDGNERADVDGYGDEIMFVNCSSDRRPPVVDRDVSPLAAEDGKPYAGCFVNATVRAFAWEHKTGGRGVSFALRAVQFVKDGESFGAGPVDAENEFEPVGMDDDMF